jgi:hypothetical protein
VSHTMYFIVGSDLSHGAVGPFHTRREAQLFIDEHKERGDAAEESIVPIPYSHKGLHAAMKSDNVTSPAEDARNLC